MGGGSFDVAVVIRRKFGTDPVSYAYEVVGGEEEGAAEELLFAATKVIYNDKKGSPEAEAYRNGKAISSFSILASPKAVEISKENEGSKRRKQNRPALCNVTNTTAAGGLEIGVLS